jgi:DNA (cytosine-5)-methyltransferase 1
MLTAIDLFSGIGGFTYAGHKAGFKTIAFAEINPFCNEVLKKNFPDIRNYGDVKEFSYQQHVNLITGGFPCQPFSIAGKKRGKEDARYLWKEFYRIIKECKPCWVVAENVIGIVKMELDNIFTDLENEGYTSEAFIIPACAANSPHRRERIWLIAHRFSERCNYCEHNRQNGHLQTNQEWDITQIQQEWSQFQPKPWSINKAEDWFEFNTAASRDDDGLSNRLDRVKSLGNSISPQIAFPILALIKKLELNGEVK